MTTSIPGQLVRQLRAAERVTVLTGAGISAESGMPTFREAQTGLWARYRPEDLATPEAFRRDPKLVWEWYAWRRKLATQALPNPGHYALAEMEQRLSGFALVTQNVDGLHQRAGSGRRFGLIELHGSIQHDKCFDCGAKQDAEEALNMDVTGQVPPRCLHCGGMLRPDVVWFGEALPAAELERAWQAARDCRIFFSVGTSGLVQPAASLPLAAKQAGALLVEVNPNRTPLSEAADIILEGPSGVVLPELVRTVWGER